MRGYPTRYSTACSHAIRRPALPAKRPRPRYRVRDGKCRPIAMWIYRARPPDGGGYTAPSTGLTRRTARCCQHARTVGGYRDERTGPGGPRGRRLELRSGRGDQGTCSATPATGPLAVPMPRACPRAQPRLAAVRKSELPWLRPDGKPGDHTLRGRRLAVIPSWFRRSIIPISTTARYGGHHQPCDPAGSPRLDASASATSSITGRFVVGGPAATALRAAKSS